MRLCGYVLSAPRGEGKRSPDCHVGRFKSVTRHVVACLQCLRKSCDDLGRQSSSYSQTAMFALRGPNREEVKSLVNVVQ